MAKRIATLGADGKVPTSQLPDMGGGGPHTHPQSDITNLVGDLAAKAASSHTHTGVYDPAGSAAAAQAASQPLDSDLTAIAALSTTAFGRAFLALADAAAARVAVGLANCDNTSDANKPVSSATQTALNGKAASSHTHAAADITSGVFPIARLATGTPDGTKFVRDDGTLATPSGGGGFSSTVATLASDQATAANTTPVTLTGLSFSYVANSKYRIWFMGRVSPAAATTGCGFQFDLSSAVTAVDLQFFHQLASTGTLSGGHSIADDASVGVSSGLPGTGTYPVTGHGLLVTGANAGTAQLRFRSETTAIITAKAGLTMVVEKIA